MRKLTAGLFLSLIFLFLCRPFGDQPAAQSVSEEYWLLEEFLHLNPDQALTSAEFSRVVRAPGVVEGSLGDHSLKIVMVYPGLQVSDYWRRSVSSFSARMEEIGLNFVLTDHFTKPETELRLQSRLISEAMSDSTDYLVFTLDALRHRGMIERMMSQGDTKIILQNITTPLRGFSQKQPFLYVGFDHAVGARLLATEFKKAFPNSGRYAIFYGPKGYVSRMRGGVFLDEMADRPDINLVASYFVGFDRERAFNAAMELLEDHEDLDFIYACSTDIAIGIIDALKQTGRLGTVKVNGWGGGEAELKAIEAGELSFTVMRMNDDNGVAMAEAIRLDLEGKAHSIPAVYSGDFKLVDQNTSQEELAAYRKHAFRYSR